jgi:hypothetical protein
MSQFQPPTATFPPSRLDNLLNRPGISTVVRHVAVAHDAMEKSGLDHFLAALVHGLIVKRAQGKGNVKKANHHRVAAGKHLGKAEVRAQARSQERREREQQWPPRSLF